MRILIGVFLVVVLTLLNGCDGVVNTTNVAGGDTRVVSGLTCDKLKVTTLSCDSEVTKLGWSVLVSFDNSDVNALPRRVKVVFSLYDKNKNLICQNQSEIMCKPGKATKVKKEMIINTKATAVAAQSYGVEASTVL